MATVFCNCGTAWITRLMHGTDVTTTYFIGWGEGAGTAAKADVALFSEVQAREIAVTSMSAFNQEQWTATMTATGVRSITNAGLFSTNSGPLAIHGDFATVALAQNDRISFTITLTST